jgi:hypothetical protein
LHTSRWLCNNITNYFCTAVFDNLHALGRIDRHFQFAAKKNLLVGHKPGEDDSQFEVKTPSIFSKSDCIRSLAAVGTAQIARRAIGIPA